MNELSRQLDPRLVAALSASPLSPWLEVLPTQWQERLDPEKHGDLARWQAAVDEVRTLAGGGDSAALETALQKLHPWRKGPYALGGVQVDTEWRSDWKWERVAPHLSDLAGRRICDIGCGNGYHCWRMAEAGAELVIGVDPSLLFLCQFTAVASFQSDLAERTFLLPLGIEAIPETVCEFDTVFSMGVLYHRKDPVGHIERLKRLLRPGGELVLETLVVEGDDRTCLVPEDRYAQMRNVWFLPSPQLLLRLAKRCGLADARIVDVNVTSLDEQRSTDWMRFHSLPEFLNPDDPTQTIEGYPAPRRATLIAHT